MKTIKANGCPAFQGDVMFRSVPALPPGAVRAKTPPEGAVVAHSETGHHHVATGDAFQMYTVPGETMKVFLVATAPVEIQHHRSTDTHEAFQLDSGGGQVIWEIGRQREWVPEGWRRVED